MHDGGVLALLAATRYQSLLLLHILAAMVWLGGLVVLTALGAHVVRIGERDAVTRFVGSLRTVGPFVLAPATIAVLGFGIWLVIDSDTWDFGQTWIDLAFALFGAAFLIGAVFQSRTAISAQRAAASGNHDEVARQLRRWLWGMRLILLLLVVITWDMVIKPGL